MSEESETVKPKAETISVEFTEQECNALMNVFDIAIKNPTSNIDELCTSKFALRARFNKSSL